MVADYNRFLLKAFDKYTEEVLLTLIASNACDVYSKDALGLTYLHKACKPARPKVVEALLQKGASFKQLDFLQRTPLSIVLSRPDNSSADYPDDPNKWEVIRLLLKNGAPLPSHRDLYLEGKRQNHNLLTVAALKNDVEVLLLLQARGADIKGPLEFIGSGNPSALSLLHWIVGQSTDCSAQIQMLVENFEFNVNKSRDFEGTLYNPLARAAESGHPENVIALLKLDAHKNVYCNNPQRVPLFHQMCLNGNAQMVCTLIVHGKQTDFSESTILNNAHAFVMGALSSKQEYAEGELKQTLQLMQKNGIDINGKTNGPYGYLRAGLTPSELVDAHRNISDETKLAHTQLLQAFQELLSPKNPSSSSR